MKALFPLDGSEATYKAVEAGLGLLHGIKGASATFLVVMSKEIKAMPADAREYLEFDDEDEVFVRDDEAKAVLQRAEAIAKRLKFSPVKSLMMAGQVKEAILAEAAKHDLLVMHRLDPSERAEKSRGGALEELARHSPCSVLLVHSR